MPEKSYSRSAVGRGDILICCLTQTVCREFEVPQPSETHVVLFKEPPCDLYNQYSSSSSVATTFDALLMSAAARILATSAWTLEMRDLWLSPRMTSDPNDETRALLALSASMPLALK